MVFIDILTNQCFFLCNILVVVLLFAIFYSYPLYCRVRANRAFQNGYYDMAEHFFSAALKISSRDAMFWFGYGVTLSRLSHYQKSLKALEHVEALEPHRQDVFLERIAILRLLKKQEKALKELTERLGVNADADELRLLRSAIEIESGLYLSAEEDCDYLIEHGDERFFAEAFNNRGLARLMMNRVADAESDFDTSYLIDPRSSVVRAYCAGVWIRRNLLQQAVTLCTATLNIDPECAAALYYRGLAQKKLGDTKAGDEDLEKAEKYNVDFVRFV